MRWTYAIVFVIGIFSAMRADAKILIQADYETGNFSQWNTRISNFCCSYSGEIVTSPVRSGNSAGRYELRYSDPLIYGGKRAETHLYGDRRVGKIGGSDEWYGFSIYFPPDYAPDFTTTSWGNELVAQWHAVADTGEAPRSPVLAMYTAAGQWLFETRHSSKPVQTGNDGTRVVLWQSPYQTGVWMDWVVHVKWSYQSDGLIEVWKDGAKIIDYKGPNCYNDQNNIYFKAGIYKWPWNNNQPTDVTKRVVYFDELRIGDSNSSYAEVAPRVPDTVAPGPPVLTLSHN